MSLINQVAVTVGAAAIIGFGSSFMTVYADSQEAKRVITELREDLGELTNENDEQLELIRSNQDGLHKNEVILKGLEKDISYISHIVQKLDKYYIQPKE